ncbi:LpxL/LpxP family acyltransferase, partial [Francisella tularensis]|uniref:LpxL/LpxP family acyltransferase n=1 Tax=Francisella tularensis TaxID=263 RepID=UPI0023AC6418|nr:LPS biosynthesis protein [Francisella tularensis subsp. holarctica]
DVSVYSIITGDQIIFIGNDLEDAILTNKILEEIIKKHHEQYLWQHRRYKTRPLGEEKIY